MLPIGSVKYTIKRYLGSKYGVVTKVKVATKVEGRE